MRLCGPNGHFKSHAPPPFRANLSWRMKLLMKAIPLFAYEKRIRLTIRIWQSLFLSIRSINFSPPLRRIANTDEVGFPGESFVDDWGWNKFSNLVGTVYKQGNIVFVADGSALLSPVGNRLSHFDLTKHVPTRETLLITAISHSHLHLNTVRISSG